MFNELLNDYSFNNTHTKGGNPKRTISKTDKIEKYIDSCRQNDGKSNGAIKFCLNVLFPLIKSIQSS